MDWIRLCSSISKEHTWYPILPLASLGVTILQLLDRIPLVLRLMKIIMESGIMVLKETIKKKGRESDGRPRETF